MAVMKIIYEKRGGHYHCTIFTARALDQTFANCGTVVFDEQEFPELPRMLRNAMLICRAVKPTNDPAHEV